LAIHHHGSVVVVFDGFGSGHGGNIPRVSLTVVVFDDDAAAAAAVIAVFIRNTLLTDRFRR